MAAIGKVSAVFSASTSGLTSGVKSASSALKGLQSDVSSLRGGMTALVAINGAQLFGSLVSSATQGISSLISMGQAQAEVIDSTSKLAARLGMTYGELSGIALAGELAGVSLETIGAAATKADVAFVKAQQGSAVAQAAFANLGITVEQLAGLNAADRFDLIAGSIAGIPGEAERAAAAVAIFGRSGAQLLPLFAGGAEGIAAAREEAERFGLALTTAQGQDVEEMNDAFTRAQKAIQGVVQQVTAYLAPAVAGITNRFSKFISDAGGASIGQFIGDGILRGAEFLAGVADWLVSNLGGAWEYASSVAQTWSSVGDYLGTVSAGFKAAFDGFAVVALGVVRLAITPMSNMIEQVSTLLSYMPGAVGIMAAQVAASAGAFKAKLDADIVSYGNSFLKNAGDVIDGKASEKAGIAIAGPFQKTIQDFRTAARDSANQIEEVKPAPIDVTQTVEFAGIDQAIKGIDSRSSEGIAEMFRLMRGGGGDVQQQQLSVLEEIAANTSGGDDSYPFALE